MALKRKHAKRPVSARAKRFALYLLVRGGVAAWKFLPRPWHPALTLETTPYVIASTATRAQTEETARAVEALYTAYSNYFSRLPTYRRERAEEILPGTLGPSQEPARSRVGRGRWPYGCRGWRRQPAHGDRR